MAHYMNDLWIDGDGPVFHSTDPATGEMVWEGRAATSAEVDQAVSAARNAADEWSNRPLAERIAITNAFAESIKNNREELAVTSSREVGKPRWESLSEVDAMIGKIPLSISALQERRSPFERESGGARAITRYKPHGVVAVFGPFNFPAHLPNGHIVPALLAGNTIVFKPSEQTPGVGQKMMELWISANLPAGVINLVQGGRDTGAALAAHHGIDGLFFTGSAAVGTALNRAFAENPGKILALEMGGNNPLIVWEAADTDAAVYLSVQSAYLTAGQRCSCARRLILKSGEEADRFIDRFISVVRTIRVGKWSDQPEPFMGPVISDQAAEKLLAAQRELIQQGGKSLVEMKAVGDRKAFLSPGVMDVTTMQDRSDAELFGPLLQVIWVNDFDEAMKEANRTAYGLCAGLISDSRMLYEQFYRKIRAGVVNWNRPTNGASSALPFGGIGRSGNHRPSAYFAADYCSYPVASLEDEKLALPQKLTPGITL